MAINERAQAVAAGETEIGANPETVWDVLTAFDRWPSWNPDVKAVSISGGVTGGTEFRWKPGPAKITSTIQPVSGLACWLGPVRPSASRRITFGD
jgi:uncharacterized protein YndB with AHSA1/START domain